MNDDKPTLTTYTSRYTLYARFVNKQGYDRLWAYPIQEQYLYTLTIIWWKCRKIRLPSPPRKKAVRDLYRGRFLPLSLSPAPCSLYCFIFILRYYLIHIVQSLSDAIRLASICMILLSFNIWSSRLINLYYNLLGLSARTHFPCEFLLYMDFEFLFKVADQL